MLVDVGWWWAMSHFFSQFSDDSDPIDLSWPDRWKDRIIYIIKAPLLFPMYYTAFDCRRPVSFSYFSLKKFKFCILCTQSMVSSNGKKGCVHGKSKLYGSIHHTFLFILSWLCITCELFLSHTIGEETFVSLDLPTLHLLDWWIFISHGLVGEGGWHYIWNQYGGVKLF